ncbi:hypothetical protein [Providencia sp. PROV077]|uniref:hypothetical protein n=1 Tax=Providencia sp. PROV077 TaxID=2949799 RepID=UPI00234B165D|nr:hypothetical protein [Providencia sp. PROV077]
MATQITINITENRNGTMDYEIIGSHTGLGATDNEIDIAKRMSLGIKKAIEAMKLTNKGKSHAH